MVTDGDAGGFDEDFPREEMPALRRAEQVAAAKCVGVHDVRFLGYPDGRVEATLGLRRDLARVIRQVRPDRVLCPSPERSYARIGVGHPDHRAVGSAALDAVYPDARNLWMQGILPVSGALILWFLGGWSIWLDYDVATANDYTMWTVPGLHWQVGGIFVIAALAALAGVISFVFMRVTAPAFFRKETLTRTSAVLVFSQEL